MPEENKRGEGRSLSSYKKIFEEQCGYYLSLGMTYEDYWDGDPEKTKFYRDKNKWDVKRKNQELWLQGIYVYEAILDAVPALNPFSKKHKPIPYRKEPIPLDDVESEQEKENKHKKELANSKAKMMEIMERVNKRFENG